MESVKPAELPDNPREHANFLSNLFFCYTLRTFWKGRKKDLNVSDLYKNLKDNKTSDLAGKLSTAWEEEVARKSKESKEPKLICAVWRTFRKNIIILGIMAFCLEFFVRLTQPIFIGFLVSYYAKSAAHTKNAYLYAGGIVLCSVISVLFNHSFMLGQLHCGMKLRIALIGMIYRKSLKLSKTAFGETSVGQIVNLITNDVGKMDSALIGFHQLWLGPLETFLIVYLIYREIGVSAFAGVLFLLIFIPVQGFLGKKVAGLRAETAKRTDERVRLMNEIIQGIQAIKMYAWELPFGQSVAEAREREIKTIRLSSYMKGIMLSFMIFVTRFSIFISLVVYALLGLYVTAEKAFVVAAYYGILRQTMTVMFPRGIAQLAETLVSLKRIQTFMLYKETQVKHPVDEDVTLNGDPNTYISVTDTDSEEDTVVDLKVLLGRRSRHESLNLTESNRDTLLLNNVKTKWDLNVEDYTLDGVSFEAKAGQLVAIIGPVGCGKSSVIQAILGELPLESGTIEANGFISYCPQDPWLFNGTIRQNILFGYPMSRRRYKMTLRQCALEKDLHHMPYGDRTYVGDRGQALSGGQKARINLARAIYREASIYLLDDPLSAVDSQVGRHLFDQCMRKYLHKNIVLLVTNQLQYLENADKIIIMEKGKIIASGTYAELTDSGVDLAGFLINKEEKKKEADLVDLVAAAALWRETYGRQRSIVSITSMEEPEPEPAADSYLLAPETREYGAIGFDLYKRYFQAGGGLWIFILMIVFCIFTQMLASGCDYFLNFWVKREAQYNEQIMKAAYEETVSENLSNKTASIPVESDLPVHNVTYIYYFTMLVGATIIVSLKRSILVFNVAMRASKNLHNAMYHGISQAAMYFFNMNPAGRILNRFSKDMGQIDEVLPSILIDMLQVFFTLFGILVVIACVNAWFIIPAVVMIVVFYALRNFYLKTSRNITRMEGTTRSPIYSHISASLAGLPTIRAFDAELVLIHEFDAHQDLHSAVYYMLISTARAFGFWLDSICLLYIATITFSFFAFGNQSAADVGLAITQAIGMTGMVQWGMRQSAELENIMTAVERVVEYEKLENEQNLSERKKPPKDWPDKGHIKFDQLSLRYLPDTETDRILKNLVLEIMPNEKIGIVGRTGAGKSSLINALFRLSFNEGKILIDGRDIDQIDLHDLRSKISIIPQEPILFSGTVRYNLDPFAEYGDDRIWQALEDVQLKDTIKASAEGLQAPVTEHGGNFSVGQRQLICLARTILRDNRILIMDEATSNVDPQTDAVIQATIRKKFKDCTVVTIAHRLNTIMDCDRVVVMDAGRIIEVGVPFKLLTEANSRILHHMAKRTGNTTFTNLFRIAEEAYKAKNKKEES